MMEVTKNLCYHFWSNFTKKIFRVQFPFKFSLFTESPIYNRNVHGKYSNVKKSWKQTCGFETNVQLQDEREQLRSDLFKPGMLHKRILIISGYWFSIYRTSNIRRMGNKYGKTNCQRQLSLFFSRVSGNMERAIYEKESSSTKKVSKEKVVQKLLFQ